MIRTRIFFGLYAFYYIIFCLFSNIFLFPFSHHCEVYDVRHVCAHDKWISKKHCTDACGCVFGFAWVNCLYLSVLAHWLWTLSLCVQRQCKVQETQLKCTKARNDYLFNLEAANVSMHKYYLQDLSALIDVSILVWGRLTSTACTLSVKKSQNSCKYK